MRYKYHIQGDVAESKSISEFTSNGFFVYIPMSNLAPYDFIACKDNQLYRIQVKSSSSIRRGNYKFDLRSTNPLYAKDFDPLNCDILVCYIVDADKLCYLRSDEIVSKTSITLKDRYSVRARNQNKQWVASDYSDINRVL